MWHGLCGAGWHGQPGLMQCKHCTPYRGSHHAASACAFASAPPPTAAASPSFTCLLSALASPSDGSLPPFLTNLIKSSVGTYLRHGYQRSDITGDENHEVAKHCAYPSGRMLLMTSQACLKRICLASARIAATMAALDGNRSPDCVWPSPSDAPASVEEPRRSKVFMRTPARSCASYECREGRLRTTHRAIPACRQAAHARRLCTCLDVAASSA
jgi:hypothetical protein